MFDISFTELVVIAVVALLVFGPEELPSLVRNTLGFLRKVRNLAGAVKTELEHEFAKAEEVKRLMADESRIADLHRQLQQDVNQAAVPIDRQAGSSERQDDTQSTATNESPQATHSVGAASRQD